jgi:hypothetical protein
VEVAEADLCLADAEVEVAEADLCLADAEVEVGEADLCLASRWPFSTPNAAPP